jgi:proteasome alpha subunit
MTDEPYRWLEAVENRREYIETQLKGGSPVFAFSLPQGILLLGVGGGQSKVFEIFDRHALAGLGHPADLERVRQTVIDTAHLEAFTRAAADVSLRRLVSFVLGPQLKSAFEQIFAPPFLVRLLLAELGPNPQRDTLARVEFDGSFHLQHGAGVLAAADERERAAQAENWLRERVKPDATPAEAAALALEAWRHLVSQEPLPETPAGVGNLREALGGRVIEAALLDRESRATARYRPLAPEQLGLADALKS